MSAVPIPDPILERQKKLVVYHPEQHDYSVTSINGGNQTKSLRLG
ncbi:hypothetical protein [Streptococcus equi]|nr:hypothetical protein [Streptococcus equi]